MKLISLSTLALAVALAGPTPALAQASNDSGGSSRAVVPAEGQDFARTAAISGLFEVETSKLALERTQNPRIRDFAQAMIADHTKADEELRRTAGTIDLPRTLDPQHQALLKALTDSGATFDATYVEQQIQAHKDAVSLFTQYSTEGPNGSLRGFAAKQLPVLQHHQEMAGMLKQG